MNIWKVSTILLAALLGCLLWSGRSARGQTQNTNYYITTFQPPRRSNVVALPGGRVDGFSCFQATYQGAMAYTETVCTALTRP